MFALSKRPKNRLILPILTLAVVLLSTSAAFAQGSIFGSVTNSDATVPANGQISFFGYLDNTDEEIRIETSVGAGYDNGNWFDDFQNYLTEAPGNPYDYHFYNVTNSEGFVLSKLIPVSSFQQEDVVLGPVSWPAEVTGLAAHALSPSQMVISWNGTPGITYHVYRRLATSNGSFFRIDDATGSLTNPGVSTAYYVDNTVDGSSTYHYLIVPEDGSGNLGPHSGILTAVSSSTEAPIVTAITPDTGYTVGGMAVTITGSNFDINGATATIGGAAVTSITVVSPYEITGLTPVGAAGPADVVVTNTSSGLPSSPLVGGFFYEANNPPVLDPIGPQTVAEGGSLSVPVTASDPDATIPTLSTSTLPTNAGFTDNGDGSGLFTFTPDFTQAGSYPITFYASDGIFTDSEVVTVTVTGTNQLPVLASIGDKSVAEGSNLNFGVSASDADATPLTLTTSTLPTNASFTDNGDGTGTFDFNPDYTQSGSYPVTFYASDGLATDSELITITVTNTNRPPALATIGAQTVAEGGNLNFNATATDPDGTIPIMTTSTLPANATFLDNGDGTGTFDFSPDFTQAGSYPVTFYASDGVATDSEVVTITVTGTNLPPVLNTIGNQTVAEGANLNFGVTSSDPDGTNPALTTTTLPANATFTDNGDGTGTFDFNPDYTQAGSYPVTFYASDGIATDSEVVTISVTNTNLPPVLATIGAQTVAEGANLNFNATATDPDGAIPTMTTSTLPTNASFTDNGDGTGTFDFNPDFTQAGSYPVTFYASDGVATDSEVVTITVTNTNRTPVLATIGAQSVAEGGNLNFNATATDPDGTIPTMSTSTLPANATFLDNGDGTGTFDFSPDFTQAGSYPVTFYASDGLATDSEVVTITVTGTNLPPVLNTIGNQTVAENANLNFNVTSSDPDGTNPALTTTTLPANATFVDNGDGTGTFDFNPDFTQEGSYPVTFYASDGIATDSEAITITVTHTNQPPVLDPIGAQLVAEGANLNFNVTSSDGDGTVPTLSTSTLPANASFTDNGDGTGTFDFNPDFTQAGSYPVTFYASDGLATDSEVVTISVNEAGNQAPVLDPIGPQTVDENVNLNFTVTASDADLTTPTLTAVDVPVNATFVDNGDGSGTFDFTPDYTQAATYNVTFIASDGILTDSEIVAITVNDVNRAPVLGPIGPQTVDEGANLNFSVSASDLDATIPVLSASALANATFTDNGDGTGVFDFNPDFTQGGILSVTFYATDGIDTDSEVVSITVNDAGNQPPVLDSIGAQMVYETATLSLTITAADPDGVFPTLSALNLPTNAAFVDNLDGTGSFDFTPDYTQAGDYFVTFKAFDGVAVDSEVVQITVLNTNRPPVLSPIGPQSVAEGGLLSLTILASDPDATIPSLSTSALPANATFVDNGDGTAAFDFSPDFTQAGVYPITFYAADAAATDSEVVTVTVGDAGNQAPVLDSIGPKLISEGQHLAITVTGYDLDGTIPAFQAVNLPINATFVDNGDGTAAFDFTPDFTQAGAYGVTFIATDGVLADSEQVLITVRELGNQAPVIDSIADQSISEGDTLILNLAATDPEGQAITFNYSSTPPLRGVTLVDNFDGTAVFTYMPDYLSAGTYTVRIFATDDGSPKLTGAMTFTLTVFDFNQPPVIDSIGPFGIKVGKTLTFAVTAHDTTDQGTGEIYLLLNNPPANATFVDSGNGTGVFTFAPTSSQVGVLTVQFMAVDNGTPPMSATRNVQITVVATNNPPVLADIPPQMVLEGGSLSFSVSATDADGTIPTLWATKLPVNASFIDNGDGTGAFTFDPDFIQAGLYAVEFHASDGIESVKKNGLIQVLEAGNQRPVLFFIGQQQTTENVLLEFDVSAGDPDSTTPSLTADPLPDGATFTDNGDGTGSFSWLPTFTQEGDYYVTFVASDGDQADSEEVYIQVLPGPAQPPVIDSTYVVSTEETGTAFFKIYTSDIDSVPPILTTTALPGGTFTDNGDFTGTFQWVTTYDDSGTYNVRVYASDPDSVDLVDSVDITFTVANKNRPPIVRFPGSQEINVSEGGTLVFTVQGLDYDGDPPILTISPDTYPNFNFVDDGAGTGTLTITPDYTQAGFYTIQFTATDGARDGLGDLMYPNDIDTLSQQFTILNVNVGPILDSIGPKTVTEGASLDFNVHATHPGGESMQIFAENVPPNMTVAGFADTRLVNFTPDYTQSGIYTVLFYVTDATGDADSEYVQITVLEAGNQSPYFLSTMPDTQVIAYGDSVYSLVAAVDPDLDNISLVLLNPPANATFVDSGNGTGSIKFVPDQTQYWQTYNFRFIATDPSGLADTMVKYVRVVAFMRGDSNSDGTVDISDITFIVSYIFRSGPAPVSEDIADANSDQRVDISDALYLVNYIFRSGPPPSD